MRPPTGCALEQQRGISVTSSVMQFPFEDCIVNLLDTPGHEDFSEDTYRTLTAVDSALMVIDCAKGVEERTIKLMDVCRLRDTPIMTFVNKLDRDGRAPDRTVGRDRERAQDPMRARHLADRHGTRSARRLSPARGPHLRLRAGREGARRYPRNHRRSRRATRRGSSWATAMPPSSRRWNWCAAPVRRSIWRRTGPRGRRRCSSVPRSTTSACANC